MLFALPAAYLLLIYVTAALLPAIFLMRWIWRHDTVEKEPPALLAALLLRGVAAALCAIVLEKVGQRLLDAVLSPDHPYYTAVLAFLVVAAVEEATKFFFLYRRTWWDTNFNYRFDGIVYAVFVSLGFAAYENIRYVLHYGLSVAVPRAILAVPGHTGFAVFMGLFYSRAKACRDRGHPLGEKVNLALGYLSAVMLHGFYDTCAMSGTLQASGLFILFVVVMYLWVIRLVRRESMADRPM